jgi:predicted metal-dependent peptidase
MSKKYIQTTIRVPEKRLKEYRKWLIDKGYSINRHINELIELILNIEGKEEKEVKDKLLRELALELFFSELQENPFFKKGIKEERKRIVNNLYRKYNYLPQEKLIKNIADILDIPSREVENLIKEVERESS